MYEFQIFYICVLFSSLLGLKVCTTIAQFKTSFVIYLIKKKRILTLNKTQLVREVLLSMCSFIG